MSLLKQLLLSVTVAIVCILVGTLAFSIDSARQYLNGQLRAQSDNAATSLALSLSQPSNQDEVLRELLMTALYDSGQFREIALRDPEGKLLFERSLPTAAGNTPQWFSQWLPLETRAVERNVSDGWRQVGSLSVTADDAYARAALWQSSVRVLMLVLGAGLLWALFAVMLIRWLKRALLQEITEQVRAIGEGRQAPPARSRVAELATVASAINDVRERVQATAQEQSARIESLQVELNSDAVTGLANRRYFINELHRSLRGVAEGSAGPAHVLIFRQRDLAQISRNTPRERVDQWLREVAVRVQEILAALPAPVPVAARLNGSDFVVLIGEMEGPQAMQLAQRIRQVLVALRLPLADGRFCRWALALTDVTPACSVGSVLGRLDHALMRAESAGHDDIEYAAHGETTTPGAQPGVGEAGWRALLDDALAAQRLFLSVAPFGGPAGTGAEFDGKVRHEAGLLLKDAQGEVMSGYLFMPAAVRLGLSGACDLRAIELGLAWLADNAGDLAIRLSLPSLTQAGFLDGVAQRLADHAGVAPRLILELDAHGLVEYGAEVRTLGGHAAAHGARVGLRRLAQQFGALAHLHEVPLSYVRIGGDFVTELRSSPGSLQLLSAMVGTASGLGIATYADGAPDEATRQVLQAQGVRVL